MCFCIHMCVSVYVFLYTHVCVLDVHASMFVCVCVHACVHTRVCVYHVYKF